MRHTTFFSLLAFALVNAATAVVRAQDAAPSPRSEYEALIKQYATSQAEYAKRLEAAPDRAAQAKLFRETNPYPTFARQFLDLANKRPLEAIAHECRAWVVLNAEPGPLCESPYTQAIDQLIQHDAQHKASERLFETMQESAFLSTAKYLEAVFEKHPDANVRGRAGYHLAMFLRNFCETIERLQIPENAKNAELFMGPALVKSLAATDPAPLQRKGEETLERVQKDYGLVEYKKALLVNLAERELFERRRLAIGKTIPEIEGEDTDGKPLKLSDARGKVVVLVFWGTWCGNCVAMLPQERALVKTFANQPFALLGVNNDTDRAKLKAFAAKQQITWPSFYDGADTLSARWNIKGWPAVFVIDANGVIRHRDLRGEPLNRAVEQLVNEAKMSR